MKTSIKALLATAALTSSIAAMANEKAGALNAPHVVHQETVFQCEDGKMVTTQRAPHQDMRVTIDGETYILERNKRSSWHLWSHNHANNYLYASYRNEEGFGWYDDGETGKLYFPVAAKDDHEATIANTTCHTNQ